jgi:hypothetical protein
LALGPDPAADIEETLKLRSQCVAPMVFVTKPTGRWFAVQRVLRFAPNPEL